MRRRSRSPAAAAVGSPAADSSLAEPLYEAHPGADEVLAAALAGAVEPDSVQIEPPGAVIALLDPAHLSAKAAALLRSQAPADGYDTNCRWSSPSSPAAPDTARSHATRRASHTAASASPSSQSCSTSASTPRRSSSRPAGRWCASA